MIKILLNLVCFILVSTTSLAQPGKIKTNISTDICIYGGNQAGIAAAVAAAREGYSVVIVEPFHQIGGILGTGFRMARDTPYPDHLGGLTLDFFKKDISYSNLRHNNGMGEHNLNMLNEMMEDYSDRIRVITDHRIVSVSTSDKFIKEAIFEFAPPNKFGVPSPKRASDNLTKINAKIFIDASYEGDLMALSGVSYRVSRESKEEYGESLAGIRVSKKFPGISPYKEKGNPASGLLSPISKLRNKPGDSSKYIMTYNFKLAWQENSSESTSGFPIGKPKNKNEDVDKLLQRYKEAGYEITWPHGNIAIFELMTGAIPGSNVNYPEGNWEERSKIWQSHIDHVRRLTKFTGENIKLLSNQNESTNGWPHLYIRQTRRMIGEYVMTQDDIQLQTDISNSIGMGYFILDIHQNRIVVLDDGTIALEGALFTNASPGPFQIPYEALIPKKEEIKNLIVPVCMSASNVAYSAIRIDYTYMIMGESAGIAASLALQNDNAVQEIDRAELKEKLKKHDQKLVWDGKGYRKWRYNIWDEVGNIPGNVNPHWETHPEEYLKYPVEELWK